MQLHWYVPFVCCEYDAHFVGHFKKDFVAHCDVLLFFEAFKLLKKISRYMTFSGKKCPHVPCDAVVLVKAAEP